MSSSCNRLFSTQPNDQLSQDPERRPRRFSIHPRLHERSPRYFGVGTVLWVHAAEKAGMLNTNQTGLRFFCRVFLAGNGTTRFLWHDYFRIVAGHTAGLNRLFHSYFQNDSLGDMIKSILPLFIHRSEYGVTMVFIFFCWVSSSSSYCLLLVLECGLSSPLVSSWFVATTMNTPNILF